MTNALQLPVIRRIVVTLDTSEAGRPGLDIAVRLAAVLGAELEGVFVEDINLIRLSGLPFLREVRACSLVEEVISTESMQRDLRALARQAERMLLEAAQAMGVGCSFRVWRGSAAMETLSTSFEADIIVSLRSLRLPTAYRAMPVISARESAAAGAVGAINVLLSDSPQADKALTAACRLAQDLGAEVRVLLPAEESLETSLHRRASELLAAHAQRASFIRLGSDTAAALATAMQASPNGVLVTEVDHPLLRHAGLANCLERLRCPVLFVR
jgi:nucleotide-binding universal stress UspA family protein